MSRISRTAAILAAIFCVAGAVMLAWSYQLAPYTNEALFHQLNAEVTYRDSAAFYALRESMLSPKYALHDFGWCLVAAGAFASLILLKKGGPLMSPQSPWTLVGLAVAAPGLQTFGSRFDLIQGLHRGEYPSWADSIMIGMMALPYLFFVLLVWHLAHLAFLSNDYQPASLAAAVSPRANWWLLAVTAVTVAIALIETGHGRYWNAIPSFMSAYFTLSIAAARRMAVS
jgi:hypothetical protein